MRVISIMLLTSRTGNFWSSYYTKVSLVLGLLGVCVSLSFYVFQISKVYSRTGQAWMTFIKVVLQETRCFLLLPLPPEPLSFGLSLLPQASLSPLKHRDYLWLITEVLLVFHKMDAPHRRWLNKITLGQAGLYQYPPSCHKLWAPER